ncbi:MAG: GNAT family N-acetyltransferase [Solirubrobacterales bacterium]
MSVEVHTDLRQLESIEAQWRALAERRGNAFLTPEGMRAWLSIYGDRAEPRVAVSRREDGGVRGILPLVTVRAGATSVLRFAGYNLGDSFHPAAEDGEDAEVAAECFAALAGLGARPAAVLDHVSVSGSWQRAAADSAGLSRGRPQRGDVLPFIELAGQSWEDFMSGRSRNLRSQVGRKTRALERDFEVTYRLAEEATLSADIAALVRLHQRRWEGRGGSGALSERPSRFHAEFAASALARGWLRLWLLELDGEPVAAWYGWRLGDRYSYYQAGFDPRFEKQSVGLVLLAHTIRAAAEEGSAVYDLLRGGEAYKSRFATAERSVHTVALTMPGSLTRLLLETEAAAWRAGQRLTPERLAMARAAYGKLERFMPGGRAR